MTLILMRALSLAGSVPNRVPPYRAALGDLCSVFRVLLINRRRNHNINLDSRGGIFTYPLHGNLCWQWLPPTHTQRPVITHHTFYGRCPHNFFRQYDSKAALDGRPIDHAVRASFPRFSRQRTVPPPITPLSKRDHTWRQHRCCCDSLCHAGHTTDLSRTHIPRLASQAS